MTKKLKVMQGLTTTPPHGTPHNASASISHFNMTCIAGFVGLPI